MGFGQDYAKLGIKEFYQTIGEDYFNPHEEDIKSLVSKIARPNLSYLDLGCGTGVVTEALLANNCKSVVGCDPFLSAEYEQRHNKKCYTFSFEDLALEKFNSFFDVIICSYAMHLVPESYLPTLLYQLSTMTDELIILTPHKRPSIDHFWTLSSECILNKTKMKTYYLTKG